MSPVFFFLFSAYGALFPFLGLYYKSLGLSGVEISLLMSAIPALLLFSQPVFGPLADRSGHRGRVLAKLLAIAATLGAAVALGRSFWTLLLLLMLWAFFAGPLVSIADSIALGESLRTGASYPVLRLWGSIGFLIVSAAAGPVYARIGLHWSFPAYGLLLLVALVATLRLPPDGTPPRKGPILSDLWTLVRTPRVFAFLLTAATLQLTVAAHNAFYSIHLQSVGGDSGSAGLAYSLAALVEVPVWIVLGRVNRRVGALPLLCIAAGGFAARWFIYSSVHTAATLVWLQALQGLTFAIFMPTSVLVMGELAPPSLRTSGQALLSIALSGIATVIGTLASGRLVDLVGTHGLYRVAGYAALLPVLGFGIMAIFQKKEA